MKTRTVTETAILCVTGLIALGLVIIPLTAHPVGPGGVSAGSKPLVLLAIAGVIALGIVAGSRYLTTRKNAQVELTVGEQYRRLADEYRRLADMAITAQEHTDLKLGEVSVRMDHLRDQLESLQTILKDVE